ncbi:MAG TPA: hypothetical protein VGG39_33230 [Polyangiaceae bacterium]|jgi:hypothetical protein
MSLPRTAALLPLLALLGCSAYGIATSEAAPVSPFSSAGDLAKVCVIRSGFPAPLYTTVVHDDGVLVGATKDDTYFCYLAEPGKHVITSDGTFGVRTADLVAQAGGRYYLKQSWLVPAVRGHAVSWVDEASAQADVHDSEYARLTEVPGNEALPGGTALAPALR